MLNISKHLKALLAQLCQHSGSCLVMMYQSECLLYCTCKLVIRFYPVLSLLMGVQVQVQLKSWCECGIA
jgi:hypothetical protein